MNHKYLTLTFIETLRYGLRTFDAGTTLTVLYLGGGDLLRFEWDGKVWEVPSSLVRQGLMR